MLKPVLTWAVLHGSAPCDTSNLCAFRMLLVCKLAAISVLYQLVITYKYDFPNKDMGDSQNGFHKRQGNSINTSVLFEIYFAQSLSTL